MDETVEDKVELPRVLRAESLSGSVTPLFSRNVRVIRSRVVESLGEVSDRLEAAQNEAEAMLQEARASAEAIREQARKEGFEEGQKAWSRAIVEAHQERARLVQDAETDLVELALQLAGQIVGRAIQLEPSVAAEVVADTLQHVRGDANVSVEVSPEDMAAVVALQKDLEALLGGVPILFRSNPDVERGGCVVVTRSQRVDARLSTQLSSMREALLGDR